MLVRYVFYKVGIVLLISFESQVDRPLVPIESREEHDMKENLQIPQKEIQVPMNIGNMPIYSQPRPSSTKKQQQPDENNLRISQQSQRYRTL